MLEKYAPPLTCTCGIRVFRDLAFPEPGVMLVTCFHCGLRHAVSLSVIAAEVAWEKMERDLHESRRSLSELKAPEPPFAGSSVGDFSLLHTAAGKAMPDAGISSDQLATNMNIRGFEPEPKVAEPEPPKPPGYKYGGML